MFFQSHIHLLRQVYFIGFWVWRVRCWSLILWWWHITMWNVFGLEAQSNRHVLIIINSNINTNLIYNLSIINMSIYFVITISYKKFTSLICIQIDFWNSINFVGTLMSLKVGCKLMKWVSWIFILFKLWCPNFYYVLSDS
jgi:hypothetical protein